MHQRFFYFFFFKRDTTRSPTQIHITSIQSYALNLKCHCAADTYVSLRKRIFSFRHCHHCRFPKIHIFCCTVISFFFFFFVCIFLFWSDAFFFVSLFACYFHWNRTYSEHGQLYILICASIRSEYTRIWWKSILLLCSH